MKIFKIIFNTFVSVLMIAILFAIYIIFVERNLLIVKNKNFDVVENHRQSIKIVQFTDTHLGEFYSLEQLERAITKINDQNPDIVIFTGDLFDIGSEFNERNSIGSTLSQINAPLGKFAVFGNRDYGGGAVRFYQSLMQEAGFTVLTDESAEIKIDDQTISLYGVDDYLLGKPNVKKLMNNIDENNLNILMTHEPDAIKNYTQYPIDLAFSGHSHGGQVNIPFYGPIVKTNLCEDYFKGLYQLDNERQTHLFVSSGLGNTKAPFRLGNIPEIISFNVNF